MKVKRTDRYFLYAALGACALFLALYLRAVGYGFVWDDVMFDSPAFRGPILDGLKYSQGELLNPESILNEGGDPIKSYRPIQFLSFRFDLAVSNFNPAFMHAHNLVVGFILLCLIFILINSLTGSRVVALLTSTLVLIHPVFVECIVYIIARTDLLMAVFLISALIASLKTNPSRQAKAFGLFLSGLLFVLALLTKETAVVFPLIVAVFHSWKPLRPNYWPQLAVFFTLAAVFVIVNQVLLQTVPTGVKSEIFEFAVKTLPYVWSSSVENILFPFDPGIARPPNLVIPHLIIFGLVLGIISFAPRIRNMPAAAKLRLNGLAAVFLTCVIITTPPIIFVLYFWFLSDRYLLVPLICFAFAASWFLVDLWQSRSRLRWPISILGLFFSAMLFVTSFIQVPRWSSFHALTEQAVVAHPESFYAQYLYGRVLQGRGDPRAIVHLVKSIDLRPRFRRAVIKIFEYFLMQDDLVRAEIILQHLKTLPHEKSASFWNGLGILHLKKAEIKSACNAFGKAQEIWNKEDSPAAKNLRIHCLPKVEKK